MKRKILATMLCCSMILCVCGCGNTTDAEKETSSVVDTETVNTENESESFNEAETSSDLEESEEGAIEEVTEEVIEGPYFEAKGLEVLGDATDIDLEGNVIIFDAYNPYTCASCPADWTIQTLRTDHPNNKRYHLESREVPEGYEAIVVDVEYMSSIPDNLRSYEAYADQKIMSTSCYFGFVDYYTGKWMDITAIQNEKTQFELEYEGTTYNIYIESVSKTDNLNTSMKKTICGSDYHGFYQYFQTYYIQIPIGYDGLLIDFAPISYSDYYNLIDGSITDFDNIADYMDAYPDKVHEFYRINPDSTREY